MSPRLSPKSKRNIARIIPFGMIWLIVGWVILFIQEAATENQNFNPSSVITLTTEVFIFASIAVFLVGLLVGSMEVLFLENLFGKRSFWKKVVYKTGFYSIFMLVVIIITYPIAAGLELHVSPFDPTVWQKFSNYGMSWDFFSTLVSMTFSLFLCFFYAGISDNLGHGVLMNLFTGKYHKPIEEIRIFMFSDMRSSTTIAEQLGHIEYFNLLKEYYADFSDSIIRYSGEVYQYIGDEIVISWKYSNGIKNNNCIKCFFAMQESLSERADWYNSNFGVTPTFKAGLHFGEVTTGEIGALKKEIIFTGDVLNTTARIQGLCNTFKADLLISGDLADELSLSSEYQIRAIGINELRGKNEPIELFIIEN